jgi:hypothetical protein
MKVFLWQGRLHFEPEGREDRDALMRVWDTERAQPASSVSESRSTGVVREKLLNGNIRDH